MTKEEKVCFKNNLKSIIENYNVLKYWAKHGTSIQVKDEKYYWRWYLSTRRPTLSDVCKHLIYSWCTGCCKAEDYLKKYEMIPTKWHIKQVYCFLSILKHEDINDETNYENLFIKYNADRLYYYARTFENDFKRAIERYTNNSFVVKSLENPLAEKELEKYSKL